MQWPMQINYLGGGGGGPEAGPGEVGAATLAGVRRHLHSGNVQASRRVELLKHLALPLSHTHTYALSTSEFVMFMM